MLNPNELSELLKNITANFHSNIGEINIRKPLYDIDPAQMQHLLDHCANLKATTFKFDHNDFSIKVIQQLFQFMQNYQLAKEKTITLQLANQNLHHADCENALIHFFNSNHGSWNLELDRLRIKHLSKPLFESIVQNTSVQALTLKNIDLSFSKETPQHTLDSFFLNTTLKSLDFNHVGYLNNDDFVDIAKGLKINKTLEEFKINICPRSSFQENYLNATLQILWAAIHNTGNLNALTITTAQGMMPNPINCINQIAPTADDLPNISNPSIQALSLQNIIIKPDFLKKILILNFPNLEKLELHDCKLTDETLCMLAEMINSLKLEKLFLEDVELCHQGQAALFNALATNSTLSELYLSDNYLSSFPQNKKIARTEHRPEVISALQNLFQQNSCLEILDIKGCNVFNEIDHQALATTLERHNRTLTVILNTHSFQRNSIENCPQLAINKLIQNERRRLISLFSLRQKMKKNSDILFEYILTQYILELSQNDTRSKPSPMPNTQQFFQADRQDNLEDKAEDPTLKPNTFMT